MLLARRRTALTAVGAVLLTLVASGLGTGAAAAPAVAPTDLVGTFQITPGACSPGASGSYFRMVLPTGTAAAGPYVENADASCAGDKTYTLLAPGTQGGLVTGKDQPAPTPGFDAKGNSLAVQVIRPVTFFGVKFSASTNAKDLQTGAATKLPTVRQDGGKLSGDLSAFDATWNKQSFNQGSPKPDGSTPGNTAPVSGTFDPASGRYSLTWTSQIVGGPFDKFTGLWHLEGTFVAGTAATSPTVAAGSGTGGTATSTPSGATATTAAGSAAPADGSATTLAAPSTTVAKSSSGKTTDAAALAADVHDDGFEAPIWLVIVLAVAGIGGVLALLVLAPGRGEATS